MLLCSIAGINWVAQEARRTGRPTVASINVGGGVSNATDAAVVAVCAEWMMEADDNTTD